MDTSGPAWGHIEDGVFIALPKIPMMLAQLGPPPFDVTLADGRVRHIVEEPAGAEQPPPATEGTQP